MGQVIDVLLEDQRRLDEMRLYGLDTKTGLTIRNDSVQPQHQWIPQWVMIALNDPWIAGRGSGSIDAQAAFEPPFSEKDIKFVRTPGELFYYFLHGNWMIGQAFAIGDMCFICTMHGSDSWMCLKGDVELDNSFRWASVIEKNGAVNAAEFLWSQLEKEQDG